MANFLLLCWEFFKTGLFSIGGGLATIPFLQEMSLKYGWFSLTDLTTMVAISESTPGPMGVNMATYVGNHVYGFFGGIATTLSVTAPAFLSIIIFACMLIVYHFKPKTHPILFIIAAAVIGILFKL